jgi:hypothetical protein
MRLVVQAVRLFGTASSSPRRAFTRRASSERRDLLINRLCGLTFQPAPNVLSEAFNAFCT